MQRGCRPSETGITIDPVFSGNLTSVGLTNRLLSIAVEPLPLKHHVSLPGNVPMD
jgi:hypothetical protein